MNPDFKEETINPNSDIGDNETIEMAEIWRLLR